MSTPVRYKSFDQLSFADIQVYSKLPPHSFWGHVENKIDFSFADRLCAVLYTGKGQYPYAPSLKLKVHLVQAYYNLSDRQTEEKIIGDLFIKRFLQLPVDFFGFDHSTIGLDRSRMGTSMFRACHLYILAQMYQQGLWGDRDEQWIIDSFPTNVRLNFPGAYRLIQHAFIRLLQHLRKYGTRAMLQELKTVPLDAVTARLGKSASAGDRLVAFSKLVAQAYGLMAWFENENVQKLLENWPHRKRSEELQTVLRHVLEENSRPAGPDGDPKPEHSEHDEAKGESSEPVLFHKIPLSERPKDRILSVVDPEARVAKRAKNIYGYKTQNLCTAGGVILDVRVIPANEHDQDAAASMTLAIQQCFGVTPSALLADSAYGHGKNRVRLFEQGIRLVAPLPAYENPTGLLHPSRFTYDAGNDAYTCPAGQKSLFKRYNPKLEGYQYFFDKQTCHSCLFRSSCTKSKTTGRTVFRSNYAELYEAAQAYNESFTGKAELQKRHIVERKNKELKYDCGLNGVKTRSRSSLEMKALCSAMIVNLKLCVRKQCCSKPGFIRRVRRAVV